jgi:predicted RNase H-like HicB family nuclease
MPFGFNSCPTTYQALMESVLGELCWKVAVVYIDDAIIFGTSYEEAKERLREVLQ